MSRHPAPTTQMGPRFVCGLIGQGIGKSLTPAMHEAVADRLGLSYVYRRIDIHDLGLTPEEAVRLIPAAGRLGFSALNITHPCKQLAVDLVDELSPAAERIGAINTVVFEEGRAVGHNTDLSGFAWAFDRSMSDVGREQVILLGAGGAGGAVAHALLSRGVGELVIIDVDRTRSSQLADSVAGATGARVRPAGVIDLPGELAGADGIVNCTPIGMAHHPGMPFAPDLLGPQHWLMDIIYRPAETALVEAARGLGCRVATGDGMAIGQAVETFRLVTGLEPDPVMFEEEFARLRAQEEIVHVG